MTCVTPKFEEDQTTTAVTIDYERHCGQADRQTDGQLSVKSSSLFVWQQ